MENAVGLALMSSKYELATLSVFLKGCCGNLVDGFRTLDAQNVGYLTLEDFREGLKRLGCSGDFESLFRLIDINQTESVSCEVFLSLLTDAEKKFGEKLSWCDESQTCSLQKVAAMLAMARKHLGAPTPLTEAEAIVNFEPPGDGPDGAIFLSPNMERMKARQHELEITKSNTVWHKAKCTLEDKVKRQLERAIKGISRNTGPAQKSPNSSTTCTSSDSEDSDPQWHQCFEWQHETPSALCEPSVSESNPEQFRGYKLRLESIEKAVMEISAGFGARFDSLADSLRVVERNVQGLFVHRREQTEMCSEMRTSLAELSQNNDKITEIYEMLPELALAAEEAKQTRVQLRQSFEQLDALETSVTDIKSTARRHSMTLDGVRQAVGKEQKARDEWCSISKRAIQNIEDFCADIQCQLPVLGKNENKHGKRFVPEMSSSAARLLLNDARMLVNESSPTVPGRCGRNKATSISASLESVLSHQLRGAEGGSTHRYDCIKSGAEKILQNNILHAGTLGLVSTRGEVSSLRPSDPENFAPFARVNSQAHK